MLAYAAFQVCAMEIFGLPENPTGPSNGRLLRMLAGQRHRSGRHFEGTSRSSHSSIEVPPAGKVSASACAAFQMAARLHAILAVYLPCTSLRAPLPSMYLYFDFAWLLIRLAACLDLLCLHRSAGSSSEALQVSAV